MKCEVLHSLATGTSYLFPDTEVLLEAAPNKTAYPYNIPYFRMTWRNKFFVNDTLTIVDCNGHRYLLMK
jgi:hypothetical protein